LEHFSWTSVCVENNNAKYVHSQLYHSFGSKDRSELPQAFFRFELTSSVNFEEFAFAISVMQQGDRLKKYRQKDDSVFTPSKFNIVLMTEKG